MLRVSRTLRHELARHPSEDEVAAALAHLGAEHAEHVQDTGEPGVETRLPRVATGLLAAAPAPRSDWLGFPRVPGNNAGACIGGGAKLVWHTTEGSTIAGAIGAYHQNNGWPHVTFDPRTGDGVQHLPLSVAARTLQSPGGDSSPNRNGARVIQVEIVGFAEGTGGWSNTLYARLARLARQLERNAGVPRRSGTEWPGTRLTEASWRTASGHVGHRHAPFNDHTDPGSAFRIEGVLGAEQEPPDRWAFQGTAGDEHITEGEPVALVQRLVNRLVARGDPYTRLEEDGIWGPKTEGAVLEFQRRHEQDLRELGAPEPVVDGIFGPLTHRVMRQRARV